MVVVNWKILSGGLLKFRSRCEICIYSMLLHHWNITTKPFTYYLVFLSTRITTYSWITYLQSTQIINFRISLRCIYKKLKSTDCLIYLACEPAMVVICCLVKICNRQLSYTFWEPALHAIYLNKLVHCWLDYTCFKDNTECPSSS
mgnify:CR=1 FL=1